MTKRDTHTQDTYNNSGVDFLGKLNVLEFKFRGKRVSLQPLEKWQVYVTPSKDVLRGMDVCVYQPRDEELTGN